MSVFATAYADWRRHMQASLTRAGRTGPQAIQLAGGCKQSEAADRPAQRTQVGGCLQAQSQQIAVNINYLLGSHLPEASK